MASGVAQNVALRVTRSILLNQGKNLQNNGNDDYKRRHFDLMPDDGHSSLMSSSMDNRRPSYNNLLHLSRLATTLPPSQSSPMLMKRNTSTVESHLSDIHSSPPPPPSRPSLKSTAGAITKSKSTSPSMDAPRPIFVINDDFATPI